MAQTAPAPSIQLWNSLLEGFYIKPEKFAQQLQDDDTFTKWLNVDHLPSMNASEDTSNTQSVSANSTLPSVNTLSQQETSSDVTQSQGSAYAAVSSPFFPSSGFQQNFQSSFLQPGLTVQYTFNTGVKGSSVQNVNQLQSAGFTSIQLPQFLTQAQTFASPVALQTVSPQAQVVQNQIMLPSFGFSQQNQQQPLTIVPQFYNMLTQFQPTKTSSPNSPTEEPEDRKRKSTGRSHQRPKRQTRPKVVEAKGAVQCKGKNKKKSAQCRNAALMEYIGPRPIYCAEHIELDPLSLYEKCRSQYQKEVGDKKGCKEVVLKEFGYCYKHYIDSVSEIVAARDYEKARKHFERIADLLTQLEREAAAAKKKDGDLYQRKNKLIPKFQEMKKVISKALEELQPKDLHDELFQTNVLVAPVLNLSPHDGLTECPEDTLEHSLKTQPDNVDNIPFDLNATGFDQFS